MDGKVVAGIGNIYASESLYLAGVNPQTAAGELSSVRAEKLAAAIKNILRRAIRAGGSTMRDFAKADGAPGYFQMQWKVYGRENTKCTARNRQKNHPKLPRYLLLPALSKVKMRMRNGGE